MMAHEKQDISLLFEFMICFYYEANLEVRTEHILFLSQRMLQTLCDSERYHMKRITQLLHTIHHVGFQLPTLETMQVSDSKWSA